jgi:hypothetical protein
MSLVTEALQEIKGTGNRYVEVETRRVQGELLRLSNHEQAITWTPRKTLAD